MVDSLRPLRALVPRHPSCIRLDTRWHRFRYAPPSHRHSRVARTSCNFWLAGCSDWWATLLLTR